MQRAMLVSCKSFISEVSVNRRKEGESTKEWRKQLKLNYF
jgi:hypothetical protein